MDKSLKRYQLFGWDYELINPLMEKELNWYVKFARELGGPILELACGTGRLLVEIARLGFDIEGIDLSKGMIEIAEKHISKLSPEIKDRIRLHNSDMTDFQFQRKFKLIFIADNSFAELQTKEKQLSCLKSVYNHLLPQGKLLVTVRRFNPKEFVNGEKVASWSEPFRNPKTGDSVQRKVEMKLVEDGKRIRGIISYKITYKDGKETIEECPFESPVMLTGDYLILFSEAGFSTKVFVGYEEKEENGKDPILCFVGEKV